MNLRLPILAAVGCAAALGLASVAASAVQFPDPAESAVTLTPLGTHHTGQFDESAAEIVAFHGGTKRTFVVNAQSGVIDVLDASDPSAPAAVGTIAAAGASWAGGTLPAGAVVNSLSVRPDGLVVAAIEAPTKTDPGWLLYADAATLEVLGAVQVGAQPDMVSVSPDGTRAVVANEAEPAEDYSIDPEGSVSVVALPQGLSAPDQAAVQTATFHAWEADGTRTLHEDVRIFGPEVNTAHPVSANLEPEYVTVDPTSTTAYVTLQENNAVAVVDLASATVTDIWPLGFKDHSQPGQGLDPSDRDNAIAIAPQPLLGIYQPDGIGAYQAGGETYLVTANEGDAREWGDYVEGARVKHLGSDGIPAICDDSPAAALTGDADLGRLNVSLANGLRADGSCYEQLYSFGGRSFSIWTTDGVQVFDSGDEFERLVAEAAPEYFNSNHSESNFDGRSDDKGPEPEGLAIGQVGDRTYAFIGFERVGGVAVYDITDPVAPAFVSYANNRDFSVSAEDEIGAGGDPADVLRRAGDLGPEGLAFVSADDSPTGEPLLIVGNEVSGSTTLFAVDTAVAQPTPGPAPTTPEPTPGVTAPAPTPPGAQGDHGRRPVAGQLPDAGADLSPWWFALGGALLAAGAGGTILARRFHR
ncbi:choice-of-anchor I family protein [uncultured Aeromicrobium sp.]|uniref:choice-of-anchor I family protein n=1 Tax=uncultured Aeromicrobium sp. TaxID=337820 RepID=UPI0025FDC48F|nr:choice-of-anchor I family protein [uncultured Aeromicrobium sp.]